MTDERQRGTRPWLWAVGAALGAFLIMFALVVGPWLLTRYPQKGLTAEQALKARNDVRTTLVQALAGLAVAGGLVVTYSTYRQNQRDQADRRAEQDRSHQLSVDRHVNDLYSKAVEQLGHDQAPVRLGALYSLVDLAQANPEQRQTVVDVLCAYLRMPFSPPGTSRPVPLKRDPAQELQVRLTAQRLLGDHLRRPEGVSGADAQRLPPSLDQTFWPGIHLDLTGAVLFQGLHLEYTSITYALFADAIFVDGAWMEGATFNEDAVFHGAKFFRDSNFDRVTFNRAVFTQAAFQGDARFREARFAGDALFDKVTFIGHASFNGVTFSTGANFARTAFGSIASFDQVICPVDASFFKAAFSGLAQFRNSTFESAVFDGAAFADGAYFGKTAFAKYGSFGGATFGRDAVFRGTTFGHAFFYGARVLRPQGSTHLLWPRGWTVEPDADDPTRGRLVDESSGIEEEEMLSMLFEDDENPSEVLGQPSRHS